MTLYKTAHGSKVVTSPTARSIITLDWFEEPDACCDCVPDRVEDGRLFWVCCSGDSDHNGGSATLEETEEMQP
jgi:hypothetical protein